MDRIIVYPAEICTDTDVLSAQKYAALGVGNALTAPFGADTTAATGFSVSCAGMVLNIASGQIIQSAAIDVTAYGSLAADSTTTMQQYLYAGGSFTLSASGSSTTQYIYATLAVADVDLTLLRYVNASDSTSTLAGEDGNGVSQATRRAPQVTLAVATTLPTGSGIIPLYSVVIPAGATAITTSMVSVFNAALFYPTIPDLAPKNSPIFTGSPRAPTQAAGDDSTLLATTAFVNQFSAGNLLSVATTSGPSAAAGGSTTVSFTPATRTKFVIFELSAGGGGAYIRFMAQVSSIQWPIQIVIGCGGLGGQSSSVAKVGNSGGASSFGSQIALTGGTGGNIAQGSGVGIIAGTGPGGSPQVTATTGITVLQSMFGASGSSGHVTGVSSSEFYGYGGAGGASGIYPGGSEAGSGTTGYDGSSGGGGSGSCVAPSGTYVNGGNGGAGALTVWQYG